MPKKIILYTKRTTNKQLRQLIREAFVDLALQEIEANERHYLRGNQPKKTECKRSSLGSVGEVDSVSSASD